MSPALISVVIPNFNRETLIGETIENLLTQTRPPEEIIVVDDGSTDGSVAVIKSFGPRVTLLRQQNQGPGAARNAGWRAARGELIQFQDSDDLFSRNKLEVQAKLLERTGADIAFSPWIKVRILDQEVELEDHVLQQALPPPHPSLACWWLRGWSTVFQSLLFRRSFLEKVGYYREDFILNEDGELFFRALTSRPVVAFSGEALTLYRVHEINKLTQDQGTARSRRVVDWARCLEQVIHRWEGSGLKPDWLTRSLFLAQLQKHLVYLEATPEASDEWVRSLREHVGKMPASWLTLVNLLIRLRERIALQSRGARWMKAYRSSAASAMQRELIHELGYTLA